MKTITVPFKPHAFQEEIYNNIKRFSVLICHRRFGKTVLTINLLVKWALQASSKRKNWRAAYIAPLFRQAEEIAWDYLKYYTSPIPGIQYNNSKLRCDFPNGSRISLLGSDNPDSLRGPYWDIAVFDEYAQIRPKVWPEIIRPALTDRKGWAIFIGTPQGKNHFHALWQDAQERPEWLARMYKASATKLLDTDELAQARSEMTPEQYEQEFECSFEAALLGAYYGPLIQDAADQGKISRVPHDPILPVHTAWDLGVDDATSIWFFQLGPGGEIRIIDYHEENGFGIDHYVKIIKEKPYLFETHLAPHDVKSRSMATGKSCYEVAESLGLKFSVVPKTEIVNGIQAVRSILPRCWFDEQKCDRGIQALKSYRKEFSERLSTYKANPLHDWSSHGADAFRYLATGMEFIESMRPKLKLKNPPALRARGEHGWML